MARHGAETLRRRYGRENVQRLFLRSRAGRPERPTTGTPRNYGAGILDARALLEASLPDPAAFARRTTRATATTVTALDRLARLWPDLTKTQVRSGLGRQMGLRGAELDEVLERFGGELLYQYSQDGELRRAVAVRQQGATSTRSAGSQPYDLRRSSSRALREALDSRAG